jgi:hypothetical protein
LDDKLLTVEFDTTYADRIKAREGGLTISKRGGRGAVGKTLRLGRR